MQSSAMRIGVIGAGQISEIYLTNLIHHFPNTEVVSICSLHGEHANMRAKEFGIRSTTYEEMLADDSIELVLCLTPTLAHYGIIRDALNAGKHVYTEKIICSTFSEALEVYELAREKHLRLGCAPDTFLGAAVQTAAKAISDGLIGEVTSASAVMNWNSARGYLPGRFTTQRGGGVGFDLGIYYVTAILSLLGPAVSVCGMVNHAGEQICMRPGSEHFGKPITADNENAMMGVVAFANGALGTLHFNGRSSRPENPMVTIMGTKGVLYLPDPNYFGGSVKYLKPGGMEDKIPEIVELPLVSGEQGNARGLGVSDMAAAIRENRMHQANAERGIHALEILTLIEKSSETGERQYLTTTF